MYLNHSAKFSNIEDKVKNKLRRNYWKVPQMGSDGALI